MYIYIYLYTDLVHYSFKRQTVNSIIPHDFSDILTVILPFLLLLLYLSPIVNQSPPPFLYSPDQITSPVLLYSFHSFPLSYPERLLLFSWFLQLLQDMNSHLKVQAKTCSVFFFLKTMF